MENNSSPENRLAVYGTLAPGQPNHHVVAEIAGHWIEGMVAGRLVEAGWGAAMGYPGLIIEEPTEIVPVWLLESVHLASHWTRLDQFEGPGYRRTAVSVQTIQGDLAAFIYVVANS